MLKKLIFPIMMVLMAGIASAISMTMELPIEAAVGQTFNMNLIVADSTGNYGVLYLVDIAGGCTAAGETHKAGGFFDEVDRTTIVSIKAPSNASTCTFTGDYQFALESGTQALTDFPTKAIAIKESCTPSTWSPSPSTVCQETTFTQTSDCDTTRQSTGTKDCNGDNDTSKDLGSGAIFIIVAIGFVLFLIAVKSIPK